MKVLKVLVVGDSKVQNTVLKKRFTSKYELIFVLSSAEAVDVLKLKESFDVLILDIKSPIADCLTVIEYIREKELDIKILSYSSEPRGEVEPKAILAGTDYFHPKPNENEAITQLMVRWDLQIKSKLANPKVNSSITEGGSKPQKIKVPYYTLKRCCYICGYENVRMHMPVEEGFREDWSNGLSPIFHAKKGFQKWDFLRSMVAVCPYS